MSVYFHNQYLPIVRLIVVSIAIVVVLVIASYFLAVQNPDPEKVSAYECGFKPYSDARENFEVRVFLVVILFFLFIWIRSSLPRIRFDNLIHLGWKSFLFFLPIASKFNILNLCSLASMIVGAIAVLNQSYIKRLLTYSAIAHVDYAFYFLELAYAHFSFHGIFAHWLEMLAASLTAFYSFRLIYLAFINTPNSSLSHFSHSHEPVLPIMFPLAFLAFCSIFVGYLFKDLFVGLGFTFFSSIFTLLLSYSLSLAGCILLLVILSGFTWTMLAAGGVLSLAVIPAYISTLNSSLITFL